MNGMNGMNMMRTKIWINIVSVSLLFTSHLMALEVPKINPAEVAVDSLVSNNENRGVPFYLKKIKEDYSNGKNKNIVESIKVYIQNSTVKSNMLKQALSWSQTDESSSGDSFIPLRGIREVNISCEVNDSINLRTDPQLALSTLVDNFNSRLEIQKDLFEKKNTIMLDSLKYPGYNVSMTMDFVSDKEYCSRFSNSYDKCLKWDKNKVPSGYRFVLEDIDESYGTKLKVYNSLTSPSEAFEFCQKARSDLIEKIADKNNNLKFSLRLIKIKSQTEEPINSSEQNIKYSKFDHPIMYSLIKSGDGGSHQNIFTSCSIVQQIPREKIGFLGIFNGTLKSQIADGSLWNRFRLINKGKINFLFNVVEENSIKIKLDSLRQIVAMKTSDTVGDGIENVYYDFFKSRYRPALNSSSNEGNDIETKVFQIYSNSLDINAFSVFNPEKNYVQFPHMIVIMKYDPVNYRLFLTVMNFQKNYLWSNKFNLSKDAPLTIDDIFNTQSWKDIQKSTEYFLKNDYLKSQSVTYFSDCSGE